MQPSVGSSLFCNGFMNVPMFTASANMGAPYNKVERTTLSILKFLLPTFFSTMPRYFSSLCGLRSIPLKENLGFSLSTFFQGSSITTFVLSAPNSNLWSSIQSVTRLSATSAHSSGFPHHRACLG